MEDHKEKKTDALRAELADIVPGSEVTMVIVFKTFNPDSKTVETHQRQLIVANFGTPQEQVFRPQATGPGPQPVRMS